MFSNVISRWYSGVKNFTCRLFGIGRQFPGVYKYFARYPNRTDLIPKFAVIGLFCHDLLYFIYVHIEVKSYGPIGRDMYKNTNPVLGEIFKIFEYPHNTPRPQADMY